MAGLVHGEKQQVFGLLGGSGLAVAALGLGQCRGADGAQQRGGPPCVGIDRLAIRNQGWFCGASSSPMARGRGLGASLALIICPLPFSTIYFAPMAQWAGAIQLSVVVIHAGAVPRMRGLRLEEEARSDAP